MAEQASVYLLPPPPPARRYFFRVKVFIVGALQEAEGLLARCCTRVNHNLACIPPSLFLESFEADRYAIRAPSTKHVIIIIRVSHYGGPLGGQSGRKKAR